MIVNKDTKISDIFKNFGFVWDFTLSIVLQKLIESCKETKKEYKIKIKYVKTKCKIIILENKENKNESNKI